MMQVESRGLAPALAARRAAATAKAPAAAGGGIMSRLRGMFGGGGQPMVPATA